MRSSLVGSRSFAVWLDARPSLLRCLLFGCALAAWTGCAGCVQMPAAAPQADAVARTLSMPLVRDLQVPPHRDRGRSWMLPEARHKSILVYSGDWTTDDVDVYDYPSGKQVGSLAGFDEPYGGCVDAKGDVFVVNFGNGTAVEYAHGGTTILNTYSPGGEPIGCSVDKKGDVAVTSFSPGGVTVYAGGNSSDGTSYSDGLSCEYQWQMGYDNKGNLIGVGQRSQITICALLAGATSETTLSTQGITIYTSGGTMWDGKYIALTDQTANDQHDTGIVEASLSGTTLTGHGEAIVGDKCNDEDDVNPFILGKRNTPINKRQGTLVVGTTPSCSYAAGIYFWHYPQGGNPYGSFTTNGYHYSVSAVSIK